MSRMISSVVRCPRCAASWSAELFSRLDADTFEAQADAIRDGSFERMTCRRCGAPFRPEHALLLVSRARGLSIVMQPPAYRPGFAELERGIEQRMAGRPRLVFGQHMLADAVRVAHAGLDAGLLECAKLLALARSAAAERRQGPFELCVERFDGGGPICAMHAVPSGERVGELALADALAEARAGEAALRRRFPELFARPYASATRYLLADPA